MSDFGKQYMKDYPLERGFEQFLDAVKDMLETDYNQKSELEAKYKKAGFKPTEEAIKVGEEEVKSRKNKVFADNHGLPYRALRKVYRLTFKKWLKK